MSSYVIEVSSALMVASNAPLATVETAGVSENQANDTIIFDP
jgi:hypothetical protein